MFCMQTYRTQKNPKNSNPKKSTNLFQHCIGLPLQLPYKFYSVWWLSCSAQTIGSQGHWRCPSSTAQTPSCTAWLHEPHKTTAGSYWLPWQACNRTAAHISPPAQKRTPTITQAWDGIHLSCLSNNKAQPPTRLMLLCKEVNSSLRYQHHLPDDRKSVSTSFIMSMALRVSTQWLSQKFQYWH